MFMLAGGSDASNTVPYAKVPRRLHAHLDLETFDETDKTGGGAACSAPLVYCFTSKGAAQVTGDGDGFIVLARFSPQ
jgi:hypothetical protein